MKTYGFIDRIEKYHEPTWDIPGPCLNAIAATKWLVAIGARGENIRLFLCPSR
jgi:hypothetical protein